MNGIVRAVKPMRWSKLRQGFGGETLSGYAVIAPPFLLVTIAMVIPAVMLVTYSFWANDAGTARPDFVFDNYVKFFERAGYMRIVLRSVAVAGGVTFITIALAYPIAYFMAFDVRRYKFLWLVLITLPFWTSYLLRVFAWKVILGFNGVINSGLIGMNIIDEPLMFLLFNPFAVVLTLAHAWAAFAILPIYLSLEKVDRSLLEAAADLGDGPLRQFFRVTLPLSMPGVISAAVIIFIPTVGDYITPALVGGPDGLMVANLIQAQFGKASNWPFGAALSLITIAFCTSILLMVIGLSRAATRRIR